VDHVYRLAGQQARLFAAGAALLAIAGFTAPGSVFDYPDIPAAATTPPNRPRAPTP
jgi:hypothetical protein